jgi:hypothetical protein
MNDYAPTDHTRCPPAAHDFALPDVEGQNSDGHGRMGCNDCGVTTFYCDTDGMYHHAAADAAPCFLVQEEGAGITPPALGCCL